MDRITRNLLSEFSERASLGDLPESDQFEHMGAYLTLQRHLGETFDTREVVVGAGGDTGLDAIGVVLNGTLVTDPELVDELAELNGFVDASFVFVQCERTSGFDASKIGTFGHGVLDFFSDAPKLVRNEDVSAAAELMEAVFRHSAKFK